MREDMVEGLFSLFTSSEHAEALAGDLIEERQQRGATWYGVHVVRLTFALWRNAVMEAPATGFALAFAGAILITAPTFAGVAAVYLFPQWIGSAVSWIALSFFWWGGALWTGRLLTALAPRRGMSACAMLAVSSALLLIVFGASIEPSELSGPVGRMFFVTALGATVALLAGCAIARRRWTDMRGQVEAER